MFDSAGEDVATSTLQLRGTVDAAKMLLQRGRSLTPRGGAHVRHTAATAVEPVSTSAANRPAVEGAAGAPSNRLVSSSQTTVERNAALDEASRLRRLLDNIGDVEQRVRDAVTQALHKERQIHRDAAEQMQVQFHVQSKDVREDNVKLQRQLQQRDSRIEALTVQISAMSSGASSASRVERLEDQVTFLTSELLARDALVDGKNKEIARLQMAVDQLEGTIGSSEATILGLKEREGALQRDVTRVHNEYIHQISALQDAVENRDASLAQAELDELGLRRELDGTQHQLAAALADLQSARELGSKSIAALEEAHHTHDLTTSMHAQEAAERMRSTRMCAVAAIERSASSSKQMSAFKLWQWWVEGVRRQRAASASRFESTASLLYLRAELGKQQVFLDCQRDLVDAFGVRAHALLQLLRYSEQQQSQLHHVVRKSETVATTQRQDLQTALAQSRADSLALQQRSDALTAEVQSMRDRLRDSDIERERFRTEAESGHKSLEAARVSSQQRVREIETMYESRLADNHDAIRREREVVERERASVARLLAIQEANETAMSTLRLECTRAQQEVAHLTSSLAHTNNSKDHADGLLSRSEASWRAERDQLLEALDAQRASTRDALIQSVTRDTEERILRQRADDAERSLKECEYQFKRAQHDLADERERLASTQQALKQQLDTMAAMRSASAQQHRRRGSTAYSTSHTPSTSRTPHVHLVEHTDCKHDPSTPDRNTTADLPQQLTTPAPVTPVLARSDMDAVAPSGDHEAVPVDPELQALTNLMTAQPPPEMPAVAGDNLVQTDSVVADNEGAEGDDIEAVVVLRASVDSLTNQLEFSIAECQKWKDQASDIAGELENLRLVTVTKVTAESSLAHLERQLKQANGTHHELIEALRQAQDRCSQLESDRAKLSEQLLVAQKVSDQLHEETCKTALLQADIAQCRGLEDDISNLTAANALLAGERRLLEEQLTQCKAALHAAEGEVKRLDSLPASDEGALGLVTDLQDRLAVCEESLAEELATTLMLRQELNMANRRTNQLQDELNEITAMSGEMKVAYDALSAPSAMQHPSPPSRATPPLPLQHVCRNCPVLEDQLALLTSEVDELSSELDTLRRSSRQHQQQEREASTDDKASLRELRVALDSAEVQVIKSHRALKRMEESKSLLESRLKDITYELGTLHGDLAEERLQHDTSVERHASLVRKLCQLLDLPYDEVRNSEDLDRCILLAVDALQAGQSIQHDDASAMLQRPQSRSSSQTQPFTSLGPMTAAEVESALQKLVYTHKREIRKLSEANAQLLNICHASVDKTMIVGALQLVANAHTNRVLGRIWQKWQLWRELKKREQVVSSAQRTISRLQDQHGRLKEIAATAMSRVKELERAK